MQNEVDYLDTQREAKDGSLGCLTNKENRKAPTCKLMVTTAAPSWFSEDSDLALHLTSPA